MEASAPRPVPGRARAPRVAAPRDLGRRAPAVRLDLVLLRLVRVRLLLPAGARRQPPLEDRPGSPVQGARASRSMALFVVGAVVYRLAAKRPEVDVLPAGILAVVCSLAGGRAPVLRVHARSTSAPPAAAMRRCSSAGPPRMRSSRCSASTGSRSRSPACGACARGRRRARPRSRRSREDAAPGRHRGVLVLLGVLRRDRRPGLDRPLLVGPMSLSDWSLDPSLVYVALAACALRARQPRAGTPERRCRPRPFFAGLLTIVIALDSPIDTYADQLFWVHMLQHVLLLTVAPPLFLLGRPWPRMWRALPLGRGRAWRARSPAAAGRSPLRALARPLPAWILFNATIVRLAHPGRLRPDAHQRHGPRVRARDVLLLRPAVLGARDRPGPAAPPARLADADRLHRRRDGRRLGAGDHARRRTRTPSTATTRRCRARPGGISALTDQQLAGGVMWVLGSISLTIALLVALYRWVAPSRRLARGSSIRSASPVRQTSLRRPRTARPSRRCRR